MIVEKIIVITFEQPDSNSKYCYIINISKFVWFIR
jgi:hypothetical protein